MASKTGVSAVIPSFNNERCLFRLLDSLKKTTYKPFEVIVVDNSPTKEVFTKGKKKYKWVKWVDAGTINIGQAMTYNIGFAHANKKNHILFIDEDVVVDPKMADYLVKRAEQEENVGVVTPMILYLNDKNWVNQAGSTVDLTTGKVSVGWGAKKDWQKPMEVQGSGTVMLFTRKLIETIGGFEDWFLCYFDPEYCLRSLKAGFKNWYEPSAIAYHDQSKDPNVWRPRVLSRAYLLGRNRTLFMRKYGNMVGYTLFLPALLGYYFIESIRFGIFPKWFELVKGTIVGYFYPITKDLKIDLPKV
jgi:GT2 family glycosyltransferase